MSGSKQIQKLNYNTNTNKKIIGNNNMEINIGLENSHCNCKRRFDFG